MKIQDIDTYVVAVTPGINWVFLRVRTDAGVHGWGECTLEGKDLSVLAAVEELSRSLRGQEVPSPSAAWHRFNSTAAWKGAALYSAMSGIDHALWDIAGKVAGLSVSRMLGGPVRDRLHLYTWAGSLEDPAFLRDQIDEARERYGYTHFKIAPVDTYFTLDRQSLRAAIERVEVVASHLPDSGRIAIDCFGRLTVPAAVSLANAVEGIPIAFLEDLVNTDDEAALRTLRNRTGATLAAGEKRYNRVHAWPLLRDNLIDYLLIDLCHAGGITESIRIAAVAETVGVGVIPHNPNGPIGMAATLHAAAVSPGVLAAESTHVRFELMETISTQPMRIVDGYIPIPDGPGLGVELDVDALLAHAGTPADFPFKGNGSAASGRI